MEEVTMTVTPTPTPNYEEVLEQMYGEMQEQTEILVGIQKETKSLYSMAKEELSAAGIDIRVLLTIAVIGFCWNCMRTWRREILKIGER